MTDIVFLKALRDKLKGGNARSIHLNSLPGRYAARLDLAELNYIEDGLADKFLQLLFSKANFEFKLSFDQMDLNSIAEDEQKRLGLLSKRLDSIFFENEDNFKEHGTKTFGFGYPLIIKPSRQDPKKIIKAPLFIWPLEIYKSMNKVNTWSVLRNKQKNEQGKIVDEDIHSIGLNEVLVSFVKTDENISIAKINEELLDDTVIDRLELIDTCIAVLESMNAESSLNTRQSLQEKLDSPVAPLPEAKWLESVTGNKPWIHFGGVFGLFRSQKESIITDIDRLIERFDDFSFDDLSVGLSGKPFSAIETDPTQQEILNSLTIQPRKIIQGPPGTGKSQTLTALITNAMDNGLKCLVVCEKKTALEVIRQNLHKENPQLAELAALIEDIQSDRDGIVNSVRERINASNAHDYFNQTGYTTKQDALAASVTSLNEQHAALERKIFQGKSWTEVVGIYLQRSKGCDPAALKGLIDYRWFSFSNTSAEVPETLALLQKAEPLFRQLSSEAHPLEILHDTIFGRDNFYGFRVVVEERSDDLIERTSLLIGDLKAHRTGADEWHQNVYPSYAGYLRKAIDEWYPFMSGTVLLPEDPLPGSLDLESICLSWQTQAEPIIRSMQSQLTGYHQWLTKHYADYYLPLRSEIDAYLSFFAEHVSIYGEKFYRNKPFDQMLTKFFGIFSKRQKLLRQARLDAVHRLSNVVGAFGRQSYLSHAFPQTEELPDLKVLHDNILQLKQQADAWYGRIEEVIEDYVHRMNAHSLHEQYQEQKEVVATQQKQVLDLVDHHNSIINDAKIDAGDTLGDHMEALAKVADKSTAVQLLLQEFRKFFSQQKTISEAFVKDLHELNDSISTPPLFHEGGIVPMNSEACSGWLNAQHQSGQLLREQIETARDYYEWKNFFVACTDPQKAIIRGFIASGLQDWTLQFESWYLGQVLLQNENRDLPRNDERIENYVRARAEFRNVQVKSILHRWQQRQQASLHRSTYAGVNPTTLFNKRGSRGERRNSLRKIINTDFELFTDFYPVVMVNPTVCSSILPLQEGLFDVVIFDEASQLRLEDTFAGLIRGKVKIVSGDSQQMPPSSYFQGGAAILDPHEEEIELAEEEELMQAKHKIDNSLNLADSESLLVFAENNGYRQSYLKVHYRSQHPALIDFSNHAFYGRRLLPMPARTAYTPIEFEQVNGVYDEQVNHDEARRVIEILLNRIQPLSDGRYPSVGIATFNLYQRNLILAELAKARQQNPEHDKKIEAFGSSLFVKNLENIQGDERDVIIISTTFGKNKEGKFRQSFGPIIQRNGYKLLNVIVTRAKMKVFVCTSIPEENIQQYPVLLQQLRNNGRAVFYAYLAYAKAVHEGNLEQVASILAQLFDNCENKVFDVAGMAGTESPFEEEVYEQLVEKLGAHRVKQQYQVGGFRVDLMILPEIPGGKMMAIECDGAKYHSSREAYAWDSFRQQELEKQGFIFHRLWSTNWWISPEKELQKLLRLSGI
ncbi:AAA domain-containing protein [Terrimonas sp. NA20]|uniref:AAA domain-containing protein n=1 Tax=Terrimonas ginsenosidimutans TaxID=2908004 RepID=A0ABS9KN21_9BACT|nr:AAA domain-containing protein [Terrimonas ginsenosidimutans]MCG2613732.1 AAA domain-containing protein [Terrimonas ginsenosidimutans]